MPHFILMVTQSRRPENLYGLDTVDCEVVAVEGEHVFLNDNAIYQNVPYGGRGKPARRPALRFADRAAAQSVVDLWNRVYRLSGIRIVEISD